MGCDIHVCVELKESWGNKWCACILEDGAFSDRNYVLFGMLAGVRGDGPTISEPRGWPPDLSPEVKTAIENDMGDHSASWLTVKEILEFHKSGEQQQYCEHFFNWLRFESTWLEYIVKETPERVRLVFNFDS